MGQFNFLVNYPFKIKNQFDLSALVQNESVLPIVVQSEYSLHYLCVHEFEEFKRL